MIEAAIALISASVPVACILLGARLAAVHHTRAIAIIEHAHEVERTAAREEAKSLRALLRDAQNRITAKDLQGYIALRAQEQTPRSFFGGRSDEEEAELEARRQSILERNKEMLVGAE